ncbi:MAG: hypothetical protein PF505_02665 [Vallitaleaceae bacterium]|jgi:hypothetical protein|nr:hypothetical protein [Vallitaleaceae bacterium]
MSKGLIMTTRENNFVTASWILGVTGEDKQVAQDFILEHGMKSFLLQHDELDLTEFNHEKIEVLKRVMGKYDGDVSTINFGDVDDVV